MLIHGGRSFGAQDRLIKYDGKGAFNKVHMQQIVSCGPADQLIKKLAHGLGGDVY